MQYTMFIASIGLEFAEKIAELLCLFQNISKVFIPHKGECVEKMADRNVSLDIEALPKHFTVLINAGTSKKIYAYNVLDSVHRDVIFLALSHPAHNMIRTLDRLGVGTDKLEFIDAITKRIDSKTSVDGCEYLYSRDYNEVLKAIERKVQSKGIQDNVLFVDALHHLLLQDDSKTAMNFLDFFHKRLKVLRLNSIFLVDLEKLRPDVRRKIEAISDKTITL